MCLWCVCVCVCASITRPIIVCTAQIRCLLVTPLLGHTGEHLVGTVVLNANDRYLYIVAYITVCVYVSLLPLVCHRYRLSYNVDMQVSVGTGPDKKSSYNKVDLKNPYFRFSSTPPAPPPGSNYENPTDQFWSSDGTQGNKVSRKYKLI